MSDDATAAPSAGPESPSVRRWRRYGHDRLYATTASGRKLGWYDVLAHEAHPATPADADLLAAAVRAWSSDVDAATCPGVASPPPAGSDLPAPPPAVDACIPAPPRPLVDANSSDAFATDPYRVVASPVPRPTTEPVSPPPPSAWEDLAGRRAGAMAREQAVALRRAAPVRTLLARLTGARTDERAWRIGAVGEEKVAAQLEKLRAHDQRWRFLHAVPVGARGSDIDHVAIGPAGVFTLNTKHHPGARIWIADETFFVNGRRRPYVRNSRHEAARASRLLSVACGFQVRVRALIVPVRPGTLTVKSPPLGVDIVARQHVARWLAHQPHALPTAIIEEIFTQARRSTTWQP